MLRNRKFVTMIGGALLSMAAMSAAHAQTVDSFSGSAFGARITTPIVPVTLTLAPVGPLPAAGGTLNNQVASANVALTGLPVGALLTTGVLTTATSGVNNVASSSASVNNLFLNLGGLVPVTLTSSLLTANSSATCFGVTGSSTILNLMLNGVTVGVTGAPNQMVDLLGLGSLTINEQITNFSPTHNEITVNALHVRLNPVAGQSGGDIIISQANSDVNCRTVVNAVNGVIPEPGTLALLGGGLGVPGCLGALRRFRRRR